MIIPCPDCRRPMLLNLDFVGNQPCSIPDAILAVAPALGTKNPWKFWSSLVVGQHYGHHREMLLRAI